MKKLYLLIGFLLFAVGSTFANERPRGTFLELHSCELYAGGCVVSSQATLEGRQMLRVWNFSGGSFNGSDLSGLQVAALQNASENLAEQKTPTGDAVIYLPRAASAEKRNALLAWLKSQPDFKPSKFKIQVTPLQFTKSATTLEFIAGRFVAVKATSLRSCDTGACGEQLWYSPRTANSVFTVAANRESTITEPALGLRWNDAAKRSIFLGRFGDETTTRDGFVSFSEICGPANELF